MNHTDMKSYMEALEEERRKIQVFHRELPLCMELVTQAIYACKKQISGAEDSTQEANRNSEIMKEFIPIRRDSTCDVDEVVDADTDDEDEHHSHCPIDEDDDKKKSDWLRSVSLWNHNPVIPLQAEQSTPVKVSQAMEVKSDDNGGALQPLQKEKTAAKSNQSSGRVASPPGSATTTSSTANTSAGENRRFEEKQEPTPRKQRRCWSPELHRRFVHALQQLGGSHATPKQIRDLMKVDGLTNDEVKSHLQKYRLHTKMPNPPQSSTGNAPQPQFVVVGGIWVPPPPPPPPAGGSGGFDITTVPIRHHRSKQNLRTRCRTTCWSAAETSTSSLVE